MRYCLTVLLTLFLHGPSHAAEPLRLGTFDIPESPTLEVCEQVLRAAYQQLGREISVEYLPSKRSLYWAKTGRLDGELCRAGPNAQLITVATPIAHWQLVAFSPQPLAITEWSDLQPYRVNYLRSMILVPEWAKGLSLFPVNSTEIGLQQLQRKRTDVMLNDYHTLLQSAKKLGVEPPFANLPPLMQGSLYHLLNERHALLATQLDQQLRAMTQSGRLQQIEQEVLSKYSAAAPLAASQSNSR